MNRHPDRTDVHHGHHDRDVPVDGDPPSGPGFPAQIIAVLWLLTGALVLALLATGRISTYIRTFWQPLTLTVGLLITGLAVSVLWLGARHENRSGGEKATVSPIAWLVFVPFLLVVLGAPSPLGAAMLDNTASGTERDAALAGNGGRVAAARGGVTFDPLSDTGVNELNLDDLHNRYSYGELEDLAGKRIKVLGFISHGGAASFDDSDGNSSTDGGGAMVNRYKIFCCAADAVAYSATLAGGTDLPEDTWVEVVGTVDTDASTSHLVLTPESITETSEPRIPYL
ncbi:TIGR03943 family putative permease subunit [Corynebacterium pygosceleis]|uniref:TIGR03943 family protein n=1 Tax=Corynebacterium pygosceleis TaxID=2800406 RepID=A0A9Q4C8U2_9CORY|nr:TIGR03943 family protein [Corynebacterium pygosceleis]MCK7638356.1 TIGR03943 family protein [Corynebacterium pygosceleis]MCK7675336.1 TIGR03943 family protein [Corynebacterium pygosceleis]MCL0121270.1 TIGR03943 family protein [Corynebacterium pygosceleis]MCX7445486.1 TIGR03943 family protein [Corynebacterium pygosceleis]MCX7469019.1 TIGR03943 family protein [Corynebacterium pygosceleis]